MRSAQDAAIRGGDGKSRKLQIVGTITCSLTRTGIFKKCPHESHCGLTTYFIPLRTGAAFSNASFARATPSSAGSVISQCFWDNFGKNRFRYSAKERIGFTWFCLCFMTDMRFVLIHYTA